MKAENFIEAKKFLESARYISKINGVEGGPSLISLFLNLAELNIRIGNQDSALEYYSKSLQILNDFFPYHKGQIGFVEEQIKSINNN